MDPANGFIILCVSLFFLVTCCAGIYRYCNSVEMMVAKSEEPLLKPNPPKHDIVVWTKFWA